MNSPNPLESALQAGFAVHVGRGVLGGYYVVMSRGGDSGIFFEETVQLAADVTPLIARWVAQAEAQKRAPQTPAPPYPQPYFGTPVQRAQRRVETRANQQREG